MLILREIGLLRVDPYIVNVMILRENSYGIRISRPPAADGSVQNEVVRFMGNAVGGCMDPVAVNEPAD